MAADRSEMRCLILVLGCHRSGTSVVARSLECLGAELGPAADWGAHDNPDFAEDRNVLAIDEYLLKARKLAWHFPSIPFVHDEGIQLDAVMLLRDRLSAHPVFVLKEPRMCRLLPFWRPVFDAVRCKVSVVEVVRHPHAVAQSLWARNEIPNRKALRLWLDHVRRYREDRDPAWPWVTVDYDRFIAGPINQLLRIASTFGMNLTLNDDPPVRPELKHWRSMLWRMPEDVQREWQAAVERAAA